MSREKYHVTQTDGGWQGKLEKADRASVKGETKEVVLSKTIEMAKTHGDSQVFIHKSNGQIHEERTYPRAIDPPSSKG